MNNTIGKTYIQYNAPIALQSPEETDPNNFIEKVMMMEKVSIDPLLVNYFDIEDLGGQVA